LTILYEVNEIRMDDPVSFLEQTVGGKKIFGIIGPFSLFQSSVLSVLGILAFENRIDKQVCAFVGQMHCLPICEKPS
jgi:hypothetical protein